MAYRRMSRASSALAACAITLYSVSISLATLNEDPLGFLGLFSLLRSFMKGEKSVNEFMIRVLLNVKWRGIRNTK